MKSVPGGSRADSITGAIFNFLGYGSKPQEEDKEATRALPASWYKSEEMYQLERRSIFSRKWQLITHSSRFKESGSWLTFDIANFSFIICKDRQGNINAFHNICRHRAFPVVTSEAGNSKIFSCKYHGWSYGLNGKLAKAPGYQELPGFDKEKNGLFSIHTHIDVNGFIWVNLDANEEPEIAWEDDFLGIDTQEKYKDFNFDDYSFDHFWQMEGDYNWKILADNYNECYHCATSHPDIVALADLHAYNVETDNAKILHNVGTTQEQKDAGLNVAVTYYFPNVSTNVTPHFFMIQRFVPSSPNKASMQYQVFRNKNSTDEQFELVSSIYKRIMSEDKYLCNLAQKNLDAGIFVNGELHPRLEKGPLHFQKTVRDTVMEHWKREQTEKEEYWPARQKVENKGNGKISLTDEMFCKGLSCGEKREELQW